MQQSPSIADRRFSRGSLSQPCRSADIQPQKALNAVEVLGFSTAKVCQKSCVFVSCLPTDAREGNIRDLLLCSHVRLKGSATLFSTFPRQDIQETISAVTFVKLGQYPVARYVCSTCRFRLPVILKPLFSLCHYSLDRLSKP